MAGTECQQRSGDPSVHARNLICQTRRKANTRLGKGPLSPPQTLEPAGADKARAAPGAEAEARRGGRGREGHPAAEKEGRCKPANPAASGDERG